jgi:hypothetical protein
MSQLSKAGEHVIRHSRSLAHTHARTSQGKRSEFAAFRLSPIIDIPSCDAQTS